MKKKLTMLLAAVAALCLALCFGACDLEAQPGMGSETGSDTQTENSTASKVTAAEWEERLGGILNCTMETKASFFGSFIGDGLVRSRYEKDKFGQEAFSEDGSIVPDMTYFFAKEGEKYYDYFYTGKSWRKMESKGETLETAMGSQAKFFRCLADAYQEFTFEEGKYTCPLLSFQPNVAEYGGELTVELKEIAVTFGEKDVVEITFRVEYEGQSGSCRVTAIGTTKIDLPQADVEE